MTYKVDKDLLSIQEARIHLELAHEAAKEMKTTSQEKLDIVIEKMIIAIQPSLADFAQQAVAETNYGIKAHKLLKNRFVCEYLAHYLQDKKYVGVVHENKADQLVEIGVPVGVVVSLIPATNPVSTTIHNILIAIKSGNAVVISPHPRAKRTIQRVVEMMQVAAESAGLPEGAISCMKLISPLGTQELFTHEATDMIMVTGVPKLLPALKKAGKPFIYGGSGNGPVFIERTCNIEKAVQQIIESRTFDNGIVSAAEQSIVLDGPIAEAVKAEFLKQGAYFMNQTEVNDLLKVLQRENGELNAESVGRSAFELAKMAKIEAPEQTRVLIYQQAYVSENNLFNREFYAPVLAMFIEPDWQLACEKCIELLMDTGKSHTLVIHSNDESVIREFSLKKPVARVLVNTPSSLGGMGATTNLIPSMTLGSANLGNMQASENISPKHLIHTRMVGYGVRELSDCLTTPVLNNDENSLEAILQQLIQKLSTENNH
ncbi:acyl-CoA reductase-like NAD-dependent aldehyde dehydrogenase [Enterococcus sp. PF1-24]|uniref:aldehyde dehydrogenase family protein n=1 Tax=unclassified Enterococcus TaxID=2608891 RepID=UPI0024770D89|nr:MULTISPECIES: aldehyde dehydrogenase family protein [unclassified Enterococcus]MDH6364080.1 acyl-CoA reductase-like NAD-dependent aldehyde dehydrogenase [Enterococcus sp. PFB1-1]MDH6401181.1 acyl-CoA reductase-like NAD-dependent aldehyde dehydrogenase [Enterococcus sp. PF1-24]